jgi:hypothetical protein
MPAKSPLALMKESFGDKAKLVEAIEKLATADLWVARTNENKGLAHVSNAKLLRLHATFKEVEEKFGTREKLIDAILDLQKRSKDVGLRQKLSSWPVPRLYDTFKATAKRVRPEPAPERAPRAPAKPDARPASKPKAAAKKAATKSAGKTAPKAAKKTAKKAAAKRRSR